LRVWWNTTETEFDGRFHLYAFLYLFKVHVLQNKPLVEVFKAHLDEQKPDTFDNMRDWLVSWKSAYMLLMQHHDTLPTPKYTRSGLASDLFHMFPQGKLKELLIQLTWDGDAEPVDPLVYIQGFDSLHLRYHRGNPHWFAVHQPPPFVAMLDSTNTSRPAAREPPRSPRDRSFVSQDRPAPRGRERRLQWEDQSPQQGASHGLSFVLLTKETPLRITIDAH
jgi:hypothetical protein